MKENDTSWWLLWTNIGELVSSYTNESPTAGTATAVVLAICVMALVVGASVFINWRSSIEGTGHHRLQGPVKLGVFRHGSGRSASIGSGGGGGGLGHETSLPSTLRGPRHKQLRNRSHSAANLSLSDRDKKRIHMIRTR